MAHLLTFFNLLFTAVAPRTTTHVRLPHTRKRKREGIERWKVAGFYTGRKPSIDRAQILSLRQEGLGPTEIAQRLKIGRASVYRALGK